MSPAYYWSGSKFPRNVVCTFGLHQVLATPHRWHDTSLAISKSKIY
jgi:hypothetical protein